MALVKFSPTVFIEITHMVFDTISSTGGSYRVVVDVYLKGYMTPFRADIGMVRGVTPTQDRDAIIENFMQQIYPS